MQSFSGSRAIASNTIGSCQRIIKEFMVEKSKERPDSGNALNGFQIKKNMWNKILGPNDFEQFDESLYFRSIEIYANDKNLELISPTSIEGKMALIETIQNRYAYFIGVPSLKNELATMNTKQMKKLVALVSKFDASSKVTREDLEHFASELFIIMKGPPVKLLEYFTENKTTLMNKRLYLIVQEELLLKGLKSVINQMPEKSRYSLVENAKIHINRIVRWKLWRFASLPLDLPFIDKVKISDDLLEKILLDGMDSHSEELITHFRNQHMIDNYERFRKAYRTIAFTAAFSYFYKHDLEKRKKAEEEKKQEFILQFKELSETITKHSTASEKTDKEIKDEQLKRILDNFKAKYKEDPTPSELKEIKNKIYNN